MRVSFLTSVVDGPIFLQQMLASIAVQTYTNLELVLVIDKPTDRSTERALIEVATRYRKKFKLILLLNDLRLGLTASLNRAAAAATGTILVRIDADDQCMPDRISVILPYFENGFHLVGNATKLKNSIGQTVGVYPTSELSHANTYQRLTNLQRVAAHSGLAFSRVLFDRIGGYDTRYRFSQDYDFMLRALEVTSDEDFVILAAQLSVVTLHSAAISQSSNREAQLLCQLEALIRFRHRAAHNGEDDCDHNIQHIIQSQKSWRRIQRSQRFKAQMRSASKFSLLISCTTQPSAWIAVLSERFLLRRLVAQMRLN